MNPANLTAGIQEALVCLLLWDDSPRGAKYVRALVPPKTFDPFWKDIAQAASDYLDQHGVPPGEHTADIIEALAARGGEKKAKTYLKLFSSMKETKDRIHLDYVLDHAIAFADYQRINTGVVAALTGLEKESKEGIQEARTALQAAMKESALLFQPGTLFTGEEALAFLDEEEETWPTGIKELDRYSLGPGPGRLHLFIAPAKHGKSWWLLNLAKRSIMSGKCVVYITLELSERLVTKRAFQSFFSLTKRQVSDLKRIKFQENEFGRFVDFSEIDIPIRPSLQDDDVHAKLRKFQSRLKNRPKFLVKQFPTGELTMRELDGYLDGLEAQGIIPDHICLDYADLMKLDESNLRASTSAVYKGLRGLAVRRGLALSTASQTNRFGAESTRVDSTHVAEDWSKIGTADTVLTYSRTDAEKQKGLARLFVAAGREDADRFSVLIAQNYATGSFCFDSTLMTDAYWQKVKGADGHDEDEKDDD